jgi:hypothetical protein
VREIKPVSEWEDRNSSSFGLEQLKVEILHLSQHAEILYFLSQTKILSSSGRACLVIHQTLNQNLMLMILVCHHLSKKVPTMVA